MIMMMMMMILMMMIMQAQNSERVSQREESYYCPFCNIILAYSYTRVSSDTEVRAAYQY